MHNVYVHAIVVITIIISAYAVHKVGDIIILLSVEYRQCIYIHMIVHVYNIVLWYVCTCTYNHVVINIFVHECRSKARQCTCIYLPCLIVIMLTV